MILQTSETFAIALANSTNGNVTIIRQNIGKSNTYNTVIV